MHGIKLMLSFVLSILENKLSMDIQNTQSQMRKGVLEFCILSIIRQGEVYPSDIVDKMKSANLNILEGTLYPLLTRLKNAGYLTYRWVESNSGPPRKYFLMTFLKIFFRRIKETIKFLFNRIGDFGNHKHDKCAYVQSQ